MFCSKCGRQQAGNAVFCSSCGNPLPRPEEAVPQPADTQQAFANTAPQPDLPPVPPIPPAPSVPPAPKKSNTTLFVLLGIGVVVLIGIVVTLVFILPQSRPASGTLASATPAATASAFVTPLPTPISTAVALRVYALPDFENVSSLSSALKGKTWALAGITNNPDQTFGEDGNITLEDLEDYSARLVFSADGSTLTIFEDSGDGKPSQEKLECTLSGKNYCETPKNSKGEYMRFYLGVDGNLYRTFMLDDEICSDYEVFAPVS